MVELVEDHRPFGLHRLGDLAEVRDDLVGGVPEVAARQHGRGVDRHRLDHDHRGPAQGPLAVVGEVPRARQAALGHVGGVRAEDDAVAQGLVADGQGRNSFGNGSAIGCRLLPQPVADEQGREQVEMPAAAVLEQRDVPGPRGRAPSPARHRSYRSPSTLARGITPRRIGSIRSPQAVEVDAGLVDEQARPADGRRRRIRAWRA